MKKLTRKIVALTLSFQIMWKSLSISMDRVKRIVVGPILFHLA